MTAREPFPDGFAAGLAQARNAVKVNWRHAYPTGACTCTPDPGVGGAHADRCFYAGRALAFEIDHRSGTAPVTNDDQGTLL